MEWFNKHLNWTYVIINIVINILAVIITVVFARGAIQSLIDNPVEFPTAFLVPGLIISGITFIFSLASSAWILHKKGQSLWWLALILVFSLALFVLALVLPNNRTGQGSVKTINEAEYYKEREADTK